jgi:hypothetical protein
LFYAVQASLPQSPVIGTGAARAGAANAISEAANDLLHIDFLLHRFAHSDLPGRVQA